MDHQPHLQSNMDLYYKLCALMNKIGLFRYFDVLLAQAEYRMEQKLHNW